MDVQYERCCGTDVHKRIIVACLKCGKKQEIRSFGTMSEEIRTLVRWFLDAKCQMAAMESTGSYWKLLYNIFELSHLEIMVVNARDMRNLLGRKIDVKDAEWIADLLQHGMLRASYIPKREQRELRELNRYRKSLIGERARELNRLQKMLEKDTRLQRDEVEASLHGTLQHRVEDIVQAGDGFLTPLQKQLIRQVVAHIDDMTKRIGEMDTLVKQYMGEYEEAMEKLDEIPGIGKQSAETILAETGLDMSRFPSEKHLSSWAGLSPGNNDSGKTAKGNPTLIQCAKAAIKKTDSFLSAQYQRLVVRRGKHRATVAVAHTILIAIYHMLKDGRLFIDLGAEYYNQFNRERKIKSYLAKLKKLDWTPEAATLSGATT